MLFSDYLNLRTSSVGWVSVIDQAWISWGRDANKQGYKHSLVSTQDRDLDSRTYIKIVHCNLFKSLGDDQRDRDKTMDYKLKYIPKDH